MCICLSFGEAKCWQLHEMSDEHSRIAMETKPTVLLKAVAGHHKDSTKSLDVVYGQRDLYRVHGSARAL